MINTDTKNDSLAPQLPTFMQKKKRNADALDTRKDRNVSIIKLIHNITFRTNVEHRGEIQTKAVNQEFKCLNVQIVGIPATEP